MGRPIRPRVRLHGPTLAALMAKHGMTSAGLANRAGCSESLIRMFTTGRRRSTYATTAQRLADVLDEPVRAFASPYTSTVLPDITPGIIDRRTDD